MNAELLILPLENKISKKQKKSLRSVLPYLSNALYQDFYKKLLSIHEMETTVVGSSTINSSNALPINKM